MSAAFKKLTPKNWMAPEEVMRFIVGLNGAEVPVPLSGEGWVSAITGPTLEQTVPAAVRDLFEVARGALVYGFFFYPLYTLGAEQVLRVADAAATLKSRAMGAPRTVHSFAQKIDWLVQNGAISADERGAWHATRELRNAVSHPTQQMILPPGAAINMIANVARNINALFAQAQRLDLSDT